MQDNWDRWLPIAQYTHNAWPNSTTKLTSFELIMGHIPKAHQVSRSTLDDLEPHLDKVMRLQWNAIKAIKEAQRLLEARKGKNFKGYNMGDKVWIKGTNFKTTHPSTKLTARCHGPFTITDVISPMVYCLELLPKWKIHNVFHAQLLSPYHETQLHRPNFPEPPLDIIEGNKEWEVEEIIGERVHGVWKKTQFRV
jgi:hypothetical protein